MNMRTRILSFLFVAMLACFCSVQKANAQWVVNDPAHMGMNSAEWATNVKKWIEQVNEMVDAQKLREGLQKIDQLKQLQSLVELAELLDDVACLSSDYRFYNEYWRQLSLFEIFKFSIRYCKLEFKYGFVI